MIAAIYARLRRLIPPLWVRWTAAGRAAVVEARKHGWKDRFAPSFMRFVTVFTHPDYPEHHLNIVSTGGWVHHGRPNYEGFSPVHGYGTSETLKAHLEKWPWGGER